MAKEKRYFRLIEIGPIAKNETNCIYFIRFIDFLFSIEDFFKLHGWGGGGAVVQINTFFLVYFFLSFYLLSLLLLLLLLVVVVVVVVVVI